MVHRVELSRDGLRLSLKLPVPTDQDPSAQPQSDAIITRFMPMRMRKRGVELRLVIQSASAARPGVDLALLRALGRARRWFEQLALGRADSLTAIARLERINVRYVVRLMPLALLAPPIVEKLADGRQPVELTTELLTRRTVLLPEWEAQQRALGLATVLS